MKKGLILLYDRLGNSTGQDVMESLGSYLSLLTHRNKNLIVKEFLVKQKCSLGGEGIKVRRICPYGLAMELEVGLLLVLMLVSISRADERVFQFKVPAPGNGY